MARPPRIIDPQFVYHVTTRGVDKRDIVLDDVDRRTFVGLLASTVQDMEWILHCWVLMSNHVHLVIRAPQANVSEGMQQLLGSYAGWFNKAHDRVGHLFQRRFHAKTIRDDSHVLEVVRYVPLNPVRAGLVGMPERWPWSSYAATAGFVTPPAWLDVDWTLTQFHPTDRDQARIWFRDFVCSARGTAIDRLMQLLMGRNLYRRGRGTDRKLFVQLAYEECGLTLEAIAARIGISRQGAKNLYDSARTLAESNSEYAALRESVRHNLTKGSDPFVKL